MARIYVGKRYRNGVFVGTSVNARQQKGCLIGLIIVGSLIYGAVHPTPPRASDLASAKHAAPAAGDLAEDLMLSGPISGHVVSATGDGRSARSDRVGELLCQGGTYEWSSALGSTPFDFEVSPPYSEPTRATATYRVGRTLGQASVDLLGEHDAYNATSGTVTIDPVHHEGTVDVVLHAAKDYWGGPDLASPPERVTGSWRCRSTEG